MNKTELIKNVAQNAEISQKEATVVVQTVVESITNTLAAGEKYNLSDSVHSKFAKELLVQAVTHKLVKKCKSQLLKYLLSKLVKN